MKTENSNNIESTIKKIIADLPNENEQEDNIETEINITALIKIFLPAIMTMIVKEGISLENIQLADVVNYKIRALEKALPYLDDWETKKRKKEVILVLKNIYKKLAPVENKP